MIEQLLEGLAAQQVETIEAARYVIPEDRVAQFYAAYESWKDLCPPTKDYEVAMFLVECGLVDKQTLSQRPLIIGLDWGDVFAPAIIIRETIAEPTAQPEPPAWVAQMKGTLQ